MRVAIRFHSNLSLQALLTRQQIFNCVHGAIRSENENKHAKLPAQTFNLEFSRRVLLLLLQDEDGNAPCEESEFFTSPKRWKED